MLKGMKKFAVILSAVLGSVAVLLLTALEFYLGVTKDVRLDVKKLRLDTACIRLYDSDGEQIETAARSSVSVRDLPDYLPNAFVAVEDKRFYTHHGLDGKRIVKAALKNIASFSFREGASTISQQLIKNTHLSGEKTLKRKLREFKLTRALEKKYSKEEILELYLNSIYFGHDAFGISAASAFYFGKDAEELTPAESSMLAALVRSPNRYSPFRDPETCLSRRNFVLSLMYEQGYLTASEYENAKEEPLPEEPSCGSSSAYLSAVFGELSRLFPDADASDLGSLSIETFLERDLQEELEKTECDSDVCLLIRSNRTGGLRALHSTCGILKRSPASTLKPLLVYAPAVEEDFISPATPLLDARADFGGYCPDDANGATDGYMSARYALAHSVNLPAVRVLNEMGCKKAAGYLERLGLHVNEDDCTLALALGGMREGFELTRLADGYSALACGGMYSPSGAIARIVRSDGTEIYRYSPEQERVFSEETSYLVSDMLRTAAREGTARKLRALPFPVCAKTGTAENDSGNTDAYTIAYTADDTVAVWMGNRDNSPVNATGGGLPANEALRIFKTIYRDNLPTPFPACEGVCTAEYDVPKYETEHKVVLADPVSPAACRNSELFKRTALPHEQCTLYSEPNIEMPRLFVKNGAVYLELCQTQYYEYTVKRENRGKTTTIYSGKYQKLICDNSVRAGESYTYTVTPAYCGHEGNPVSLPSVRIEGGEALPDDWWKD